PTPAADKRAEGSKRLRLEHRHLARIKTEPQPAFKERAAHFAGANECDQTGEVAQALVCIRRGARSFRRRSGGDHASPVVSNIADSIASRAHFPPHMTNRNAGK